MKLEVRLALQRRVREQSPLTAGFNYSLCKLLVDRLEEMLQDPENKELFCRGYLSDEEPIMQHLYMQLFPFTLEDVYLQDNNPEYFLEAARSFLQIFEPDVLDNNETE